MCLKSIYLYKIYKLRKRRDGQILIFCQYQFHCLKSIQIQSSSGPYFPVFRPNTRKYEPEKTSYLDAFHAVSWLNTTKCYNLILGIMSAEIYITVYKMWITFKFALLSFPITFNWINIWIIRKTENKILFVELWISGHKMLVNGSCKVSK